ncbi:c-type cytochrome [Methylocaldum sp.]|uniref:c-type cytochrome n=1 Tax=Methylocaldum sp. TaxID=1969727 RepID=UPI002D32A935|nr:c-type cytochrome [Methylocaldum sp.]HYE34578.1 c-type cytochrome [Methylocaldum sp.]
MDEGKRPNHLGVWLVLLGLLGLNIVLSFLDLGVLNPILTIAIAALQAFVIVTFFMYMRSAAPVPRIAAAIGFFWLFLMIALTMTDYQTRFEDIALGRLLPEPGWESPPVGAVPNPLAESDYSPAPLQPAPTPAPTAFDAASGEHIYVSVCIVCHGEGLGEAPRAGDKAAWLKRMEQGVDTLVAHAFNGFKGMPPKGGHPELSEQDIRNAVGYMLYASGIELPRRAGSKIESD